jgi:acetyl esterase/lipase
VGFSIGGAQAAFAAVVDEPASFMSTCPNPLPEQDYIDTVVTVAGFFNYELWISGAAEDGLIHTYFGPPNAHMEEIRLASAVNWVDGSEPPFLLIHGENDNSVDPLQSMMFADLLREAGVEVDLQIESNLPHDNILTSISVWMAIKNYLDSRYSQ